MEPLEKYFDIAFAAPDGIKKLRELILTLAMQGKLVTQDPNDQPVSELLKDIEAEKRRLVKAGKIREPKLLPDIKPEDVPYELPAGWEWVRFGNIAQHNSGKMLDKSRNKGKYRDYITTSNLYWGFFELDNVRQMPIRDEEIEKCTARKGDLLLCEGGEAGRAAVWFYDNEVCFQNHIHRARFYCDIDPYYAYRFFEKLNATGEINQYRQGVGISNMSGKVLASIVLPLPPLAEQKRIVARIDQLMARCDELEKLRAEREAKRLTVHISALNRLFEAQGSDSFTGAWQFINRHFGELYSVKANVTELRKAILQLGVMGKLVLQDPNDQPASELLKEIEAEKRRLVKTGKIREPKLVPEIKPEEVPYELPESWSWVRLGKISEVNGGFAFKSSKYVNDGVRVVRISDFDEKGFKNHKIVRYTFSADLNIFKLEPNNILMAMTGGTVGKSLLVKALSEPMVVNQRVATIKILSGVLPEFVNSLIQTDLIQRVIYTAKNSTNDNISMGDITGFYVPLPSFAEQKRIVTRIDQLMAMCDELEHQIDATASKQSILLNAVMAMI